MKLQVIRFFNINSLKGKHEIVFDEEPLRSAGLFAITGATGAGKSTILDVITLALYNYVPRLGKISRSGIEKMGSIITHFTEEAWAEVEYESGGQKYLSRWSISKTRNDTFRDYEMDIIQLPEQSSLGLKKSEVPDKNAEIIGLNVDQFLKSILLSQGDFSRFLQAKKEDRTKLLQEITGTKIYQELGQMAFELVKDRKAEIELLESNKSMIQVLSEEDVSLLNLNKNNLSESIDKNKNLLEKQEVLISLYKKKENLDKATVLISQKKGLVEEQERDFKQYFPLIEKHHEAKDYESQILAFENATKEIERISKDIEETKEAQVNSVKLIDKSIVDASALIQKQSSKEYIYEDLIEFQQKINTLDNSLDKYKSQGEIVRTEIINTQNDSNVLWVKTLGSKNKPSDSISAIEIRLQEIPINADESFNDLQASWSNKQSRLNSLKIYHEEYSKAKSFGEEIQRDEAWKKQADEKVLEDQIQYKKSLHREIEIEKRLKEKKHARDELSKISSLKDFSHLVKENQPCPLCGSVHHPDVFHDSLSELEKLDLIVAKLEREHRSIEESTKQYLKNIDQLKLSISSKEKQLASLHDQLQVKSNLLNTQTKENPWLLEITDESWKQTAETYAQEIELLDKKIKHFQENQLLQQLLTKYGELQSIGIDYLKIKTGRDKLYEGKNITLDSDYIQNAFTKSFSEHEAAIRQEQKLLNSLKENEQIRIETTATLKPLLKKYKLTHSNEARSLIINNTEYRSIIEKREQLISTRSSVETLQNELQKIQKEYELLLKNIDKESLLNFENSSRSLIEEQQQKLKELLQENNKELGVLSEKSRTNLEAIQQVSILEKEIVDKRENSKTWILLNELIGDAKGKKFANFAQNLTLMHLLNRANARLASLTDRYILSFKPEEEDLLIVDKYQGDTLRTVKTLSGGETFIISLALALSLSDFAAQSIKLESLFIDEGFGTLDQQTLDLAMTTLEKLQHNSGKRIGIISHVESLKERIQTQILVQKNARGYSSIDIIPK